ncbi:MAG: 50S ribosomal protein L21 [Anaerolineae bacterium]|nr:50S ribosomal protein L21 [Anaerolineae bacterium]
MYAIIKAVGRQYKVEPGKTVVTEKMPVEAGATIDLTEVLLVVNDNGSAVVGQPTVKGAVVRATVVEQYRGEKVLVFHYRAKQRIRKRRGHRQSLTRLKIESINV